MAHSLRPVFIGSAWPYANGSLHIGHIAALLPADCLARFFRLKGHPVLFVSGSDCHGTPISVRAEKEHVTPQHIAEKYHHEFANTFEKLGFSYSLYGNTMDSSHVKVVQAIFLVLMKKKFIYKKTANALYCEFDKRFLPDRYIEGECPVCHFIQARGDQCDSCGSLLDPEKLIHPICKLCGRIPVTQETEHFYFTLSKFQKQITAYVKTLHDPRGNVRKFVEQYLENGLQDRPITRDLDWGIPVPVSGYEHKRVYVWFEAVCGYLSASELWSEKHAVDWRKFWGKDASAWYVYAKDNIPFHTILWPAICMAYDKDLHLPDWHISSEYLQIEGKKISKSRNWALWLPDVQAIFSQTHIRYTLIALAPETADANFTLREFKDKFNNEFIATLANYVQRVLVLAKKAGIQRISSDDPSMRSLTEMKESFLQIGQLLQEGHIRSATAEILRIASLGNKQLDIDAPWKSLATDRASAKASIQRHCRLAAQFGTLLEPILPEAAQRLRQVLGMDVPLQWKPYEGPADLQIPSEPLFAKITDEQIEMLRKKLPIS